MNGRALFIAAVIITLVTRVSWAQQKSSVDSLLEQLNASGMRADVLISELSKPLLHGTAPHDLAMVHDRIAYAFKELEIYDSASVHAWHVLRLAPEDNVLRSRALALLGFLAFETEAWERSAGYYGEAARLFRVIEDKTSLLEALHYQAQIDQQLGFTEYALSKYEEARALSRELNDAHTEKQLLLELAVLYRTLGRFRDAEDHLNRSLILGKNDTAQLSKVRREWGMLLEDQGSLREARAYYLQGLNGARASDPFPGYLDLVRVNASLQLLDSANQYADSAEYVAIVSGNIRYLRACFQARHQLSVQMNDSAQAYSYLVKFKAYDDSVTRQEMRRSVENVRHELFLSTSEASVRAAELQTWLDELSARRERDQQVFILMSVGLGAAAAIFLGMWFFTWRRNRERLKQQRSHTQDLAAKNAKVFAVMARDLQGPVATFSNLSRSMPMLLKGASMEDIHVTVRGLHRSAQELQQTLQELLDWAVTQSDAMPYRPEMFSCWKLAGEVKDELQPWADEHGVTATLLVPEGVTTFADRAMIKIIWRTLLFNAIRFSREGQTVTLFSGKKENVITMGVKDNGQGIAQSRLQVLLSWEPPGTATKEKGIGLPMCRELVRRNGGDLFAESQEGHGSTFYFTLPEHPPTTQF